jgi:hypothetical protein
VSLPEIPDGARSAAIYAYTWAEFRAGLEYRDDTADLPLAALAAAWPHLYATALRHAADELEARTWVDSHDLRRLADEADPQP